MKTRFLTVAFCLYFLTLSLNSFAQENPPPPVDSTASSPTSEPAKVLPPESAASTEPSPPSPAPSAEAAPAINAIENQPSVEPTATPTPPAAPIPKKKVSRTERIERLKEFRRRKPGPAGEYQLPLRFDPEDNGLSIENPQIKYLIRSDEKIDLGGLVIDSGQINFVLDQLPRDKVPVLFDDKTKTSRLVTSMSLQWPVLLASEGELSLQSLDGRVIWKAAVSDTSSKEWRERRDTLPIDMKKDHMNSSWGIFDVPQEILRPFQKGGRFRACFSKSASAAGATSEILKICTRGYRAVAKGDAIDIEGLPAQTRRPTTVFANGGALQRSGLINFPYDKSVEIRLGFADGSDITIAARPSNPELIDVTLSPDRKEIFLTGVGVKPLGGRARVLQKPVTHFWAPTGIKQDLVWQISIPIEKPTIRIQGSFNIPFTLLFTGERLPSESDRVYIKQTRSSGTYSSSPVVQGYIPSGGVVSSSEYSVNKTGSNTFDWGYAAPRRGDKNRAHILVQNEKDVVHPWVAHLEMYRSYPYEISGRLTGILGSDFTFIVMAEASAAAWFETIGISQDKYWSKQRWGLSARYLKSLTAIESQNSASISDYATMNFDLKYNILPGIWHRDEIVGVMTGYQQLTLAGYNIAFAGVGAYWARTMPKLFNELFNLLPLMDYPKYVDMEFIYYPMTLTSSVSVGPTFNLNFHGRVFWSKTLYGEAGFGIRQYQFSAPKRTAPSQTSNVALSAAYGTVGLGLAF